MRKIGIILNNIGSPSDATPDAVSTYLKEFLMDKEIINSPFLIRFFLVNFLIVPRRKFASSLKYKKIWRKESPLIEISKSFLQQVQEQLNLRNDAEYVVRLGMRYGEPSIKSCLQDFKSQQITDVIFAPMYPQFAKATTFSAVQHAEKWVSEIYNRSAVRFKSVQPFYLLPGFIQLSAEKLRKDWQTNHWQHVLFSFHGLPESQIKKVQGCLSDSSCCEKQKACENNCYRAQCFKTAQLISQQLNLKSDQYTVCFQSRLGPTKWIQPASIDVVQQLAEKNIKNILVQTPSFVADCLETLEEISIELKNEFKSHGGNDLKLVDCLNADRDWAVEFAHYLLQYSND